jgi:hypothetical protein
MTCLFHLVQMHISYSSCAKAKTNVLPRVSLYLVLNWKGNGVVGKGKAFAPYSSVSFALLMYLLHIFLDKDPSISLFLVLNAKGGEINRPKQKDCTTTLFSENFLNYQNPLDC